jgi:hypothetical protein
MFCAMQMQTNFNSQFIYPGYEQCTKDYHCSRGCVKAYMKRYGNWVCEANCEGFARMHNGGPRGCLQYKTETYWSKMKKAGCGVIRG